LSVDPRMAARAMVVAVVLVAVGVAMASLMQTPTYEASVHVLLGWEQKVPWNTLGYREPPTQEIMHTIETRSIAQDARRRLGLPIGAAELLDNLTVEQVEGTSFIRLTYEDTNPVRAKQIVNTVGKVAKPSFERSSPFTAIVWEKAIVPESPVSPHPLRNGLLTLVIGLMLCAGTVVALPGVGARVAGTLGERPTRQGVGLAGVLRRQRRDRSIVERVKEKKLLLALGRRGKLTAVEAALETSLSVEEANRMLFDLVAKGHLQLIVEHGRLYYAHWGD
jgi:capsular polysaccharide biosynthesis protein